MNQLDTVWITSPFAKPFTNHYNKGPQIGEAGGHATAYKCTRRSDDCALAVKEIHKSKIYESSAESQNREAIIHGMKTEIEIMKRLKHRYIVSMHETYETKDVLHIVMDECEGGELAEKLLQRDSFAENETKPIARMICEALLYLHEQNVVHLDLKPENILFVDSSSESDIKIIDFGLSKILSKPISMDNVSGTYYYNAPETIRGTISRSADLWSVGVIVFLMVFGFFPFFVDSHSGCNESEEVRQKILEGFDPIVKSGFGNFFPKSMRSSISKDGMDFISSLLEMDPAKRLTAKEALLHPWLNSHRSKELGSDQLRRDLNDTSTSTSTKKTKNQTFGNVLFLMLMIAILNASKQWIKLLILAKCPIVLLLVCFTFSNFMPLWSITP